MGQHKAGRDLTEFLDQAPHGEEVFERLPRLEDVDNNRDAGTTNEKKDKLQELYQLFHPHPMLIHFPIGILHFAILMQILFLFTGVVHFERAAFYALVCATLSLFPAIAAGLLSWWVNYKLSLTSLFKYKILFSIVTVILTSSASILRWSVPELAQTPDSWGILYMVLLFAALPSLIIVAYHGGKITWPT